NENVHPGAAEVCNSLDDNCNGQIDEGVTATFYADADGDGYGDASTTTQACSVPGGYVSNSTDCNDDPDQSGGNVHPGATEICNGIDDNCNSQIDEGTACDLDGDGYTTSQGDCDDNNPGIYPGAAEVCNSLDDNCNGQIDEGVTATFY